MNSLQFALENGSLKLECLGNDNMVYPNEVSKLYIVQREKHHSFLYLTVSNTIRAHGAKTGFKHS